MINYIIILLFILLIIFIYNSDKRVNIEKFENLNDYHTCPNCLKRDITCKDAAGQTYFNDLNCLDPSKDPHGGLGCMGGMVNGKKNICRYCGFNQFVPVKCPASPSPPSQIPITPLGPTIPITPLGPPIPITPLGPPSTPNNNYRVNLINECPVTILTAALGPSKIKPINNQPWVLESGQSLKLDIPKDWETTQGNQNVNGPRFYARTGCTYDEKLDIASCETGDCGSKFDCSNANLAGSPPVSLAEFCFNCGNGYTYYDVSLVDGANMSIDIKPEQPYSRVHPGDPSDPFWSVSGLCNQGQDLRSSTICPKEFQLSNTDLKHYNPNNKPVVAACFSNCGKWAYLKGLPEELSCPKKIDRLDCLKNIDKNWRKYCCQSSTSGKACGTDMDCKESEACWNGKCECRAFYKNHCPPNICTHPYCQNTTKKFSESNPTIFGSVNNPNDSVIPVRTHITKKYTKSSNCPGGFDTQPKPEYCTNDPNCIGDDTFHKVCPNAYTWPNDPQTYNSDSKEYTITFCPGGSPVKMSNSINGIPNCNLLKKFPEYDYEKARHDCSPEIKAGNKIACARKTSDGSWACGVRSSCYNLGMLCQFDAQ